MFYGILHLSLISFVLNLICILTIIFYEKRKPAETVAWVLLLGFTSYFGFFIYLFFGMSFRKKRMTKTKMKRRNLSQPNYDEIIIDEANPLKIKYVEFFKFLSINAGANLYIKNKVDIIIEGKKLYDDIFDAIKNADKYIHMEYYIVRDDEVGKKLINLLTQKVKQGVEVKFIYDGFGSRKLKMNFFKKFRKEGGEAVCFFPLTVPHFSLRANYRNHRKICIIDGKIAYLGGFNLGEEYLGRSSLGYWRDTHLKIQGNAITDIQLEFLLDYEFALGKEIMKEKYFCQNKEKENGITMQIVGSGPNYEFPLIKDAILKLLSGAKKSIYIQTPYFIPDESILEMLKILLMSGVKVFIMIPNKPDHPLVYSATKSYVGEILKLGAKCYIYRKGFLHSKVLIVDDEIATVGTTNMDLRSFYLDFEMNAFIYNIQKVQELKNIYIKDLRDCDLLTIDIYIKRKRKEKIKESIARLLSPIL